MEENPPSLSINLDDSIPPSSPVVSPTKTGEQGQEKDKQAKTGKSSKSLEVLESHRKMSFHLILSSFSSRSSELLMSELFFWVQHISNFKNFKKTLQEDDLTRNLEHR